MSKDVSRPDFSNYLAHFTKKNEVSRSNEITNLISILEQKKINAHETPWTGSECVCFTECPWTSLLAHAETYSSYGVGFAKGFVFSQDGNPVFYLRPDIFEKVKKQETIHPYLYSFITPFWPPYVSEKTKKGVAFSKVCDYTHEREWRVPHDFNFEYKHIEFIILNDYDDMAKFPKELKDAIGREKFILLENYKTIETLWPVHKI